MSIGSNIKAIRTEKGITIKELAAMVNVTTSLISQIEHDKANPSINTLLAISTALNTDIRTFFQGYAPDEPAMVVRPEDRILVGNSETGWIQEYLTSSDLKRFSVIYQRVPPGASTRKVPEINDPAQEGYEFGYVIKGRLKVTVEKTAYVLEAGDAITFEAQKDHYLVNCYKEDTELIWLIIPGRKQG